MVFQIRTLSPLDGRKLIAIPAASVIIAIGLFFILLLSVCVLTVLIFRFRQKRRRQQINGNSNIIDDDDTDNNQQQQQQPRSSTMVSFGSVTTSSLINTINNGNGNNGNKSLAATNLILTSDEDMTELDTVVDEYITYRHFALPSNEQHVFSGPTLDHHHHQHDPSPYCT